MVEKHIEEPATMHERVLGDLVTRLTWLRENAAREPRPGDLLEFRVDLEEQILWALLRQHPKEPGHFLAVPVDDRHLLGGPDLRIRATAPFGPLTLRCGESRWIDPSRLERGRLWGYLEPSDVARARGQIAAVVSGNIICLPSQVEVSASREYDDWMVRVRSAGDALDGILTVRPLEVLLSWFSGSPSLRYADGLSAAAREEPSALLGRLAGGVDEAGAYDLDWAGAGTLRLRHRDEGVELLYLGMEPPSVRALGETGEVGPLDWVKTEQEGAWTLRDPLCWEEESISVHIGGEDPVDLTIKR